MTDQKSDRRAFLKKMGLTAGATLAGTSGFASFVKDDEIRQLNDEQREFMTRYSSWMDEYTAIIRLQKSDPDNVEFQQQMIQAANEAEKFQPELIEFMKDGTFAFIYKNAIKRVTDEI